MFRTYVGFNQNLCTVVIAMHLGIPVVGYIATPM